MLPHIHRTTPAYVDTRSSVDKNSRSETASNQGALDLEQRVRWLERENERFREELVTWKRQKTTRDGQVLAKLQQLLNEKIEEDALHMHLEQHKLALLFAEVSRLSNGFVEMDEKLSEVSKGTKAKLDQQSHRLQSFINEYNTKTVESALNLPRDSHGVPEEIHQAISQLRTQLSSLRTDVENNRTECWKKEGGVSQSLTEMRSALVDVENRINEKVASSVSALQARCTADKIELVHVLEEQRQLLAGTDLKRLHLQTQDIQKVSDGLVALEHWAVSEFRHLKRILQWMTQESEGQVQALAGQVTASMRRLNSVALERTAETSKCVGEMKALADTVQRNVLKWNKNLDEVNGWKVSVERSLDHVVDSYESTDRHIKELEDVLQLEVRARQDSDARMKQLVNKDAEGWMKKLSTTREEVVRVLKRHRERLDTVDVVQETLLEFMNASCNQRMEEKDLLSISRSVTPQLSVTFSQSTSVDASTCPMTPLHKNIPCGATTMPAPSIVNMRKKSQGKIHRDETAISVMPSLAVEVEELPGTNSTASCLSSHGTIKAWWQAKLDHVEQNSAIQGCLDAIVAQVTIASVAEKLSVVQTLLDTALKQEHNSVGNREATISILASETRDDGEVNRLKNEILQSLKMELHLSETNIHGFQNEGLPLHPPPVHVDRLDIAKQEELGRVRDNDTLPPTARNMELKTVQNDEVHFGSDEKVAITFDQVDNTEQQMHEDNLTTSDDGSIDHGITAPPCYIQIGVTNNAEQRAVEMEHIRQCLEGIVHHVVSLDR